MKLNNIILCISCGIFIVIGFPAVADSQFGHRRSEHSSQSHWQGGSSSNTSSDTSSNKSSYESSHDKSSSHNKSNRNSSHRNSDRSSERLKIKSWSRDQHQEESRSKPYRTSNDRGHRSPGNDSKSGDDHRRSPSPPDQAPPPKNDRRKQPPEHRPDNRHKDRGHRPPRDHEQRPDKRPDQQHRPDHRRDDHQRDRRQDHRDDHRHKPYYPPRHDHRHYPRPKYRLHKRHKYIYYYTPWYNTWFLAPIFWHYHRIGFTLEILPTPYIRIVVGGIPYFYARGTFYRPYGSGYVVVAAPMGAVVTTLPPGYIAFSLGLDAYYFVNDTYYVWDEPRDGFVVVPKPDGADKAMQKATQGRLYAYPNKGQSDEQQAKDRYECHLWAVSESGVDPTLEEQDYTDREKRDYKRAIAACLEGRDYTVK